MNSCTVALTFCLLTTLQAGPASAQAPAPAAAAGPDLEPGVQTSSAPATVPLPPPAAVKPAAPAQAPAAARAPVAPGAATAAAGAPKGKDRIELDTTQISGNRELPKVMYVVPWRRADLGEFAGRPPNSLLDEALTPVDRDVFRRQNRYYSALESGAGATKSQPDAAAGKAAAPEARDEK
jgi:hypothetical protein